MSNYDTIRLEKGMYAGGKSLTHTPVSYTHLDVYKRQGYCGNIVLEDVTIFTCTYGRFGDTYQNQEGKSALRTYIASRRINLAVTDRLAAK